MKAYWVVRGHILNPEEYAKYINLAGPVVKKYQGTFLSRGGRQEEKEGSGYERTVLIEFNSYEEALFFTTLMNTKKRLNMSKTLQIDW